MLQYLMGHSDIGVTLNTYTPLGLENAMDELKRVKELENARNEMEKKNGGRDSFTENVPGNSKIGCGLRIFALIKERIH